MKPITWIFLISILTWTLPLGRAETRKFEVQVVRGSKSHRTYVFSVKDGDLPKVGKLLILRQGTEKIMSLRVLKRYLQQKEFAGKKLKIYGEKKELKRKEEFTAYEKEEAEEGRDPAAEAAPVTTAANDPELDQLDPGLEPDLKAGATVHAKKSAEDEELPAFPSGEPNTVDAPKFDKDLDAGSSPTPEEKIEKLNEEKTTDYDESDYTEEYGKPIEEVELIDPFNQGLSLQYAYIRTVGYNSASEYYSGLGLRYTRRLVKRVFLRGSDVQDEINFEPALFYYKLVNYVLVGDGYTVYSGVLTGRYHIHLSHDFGIFGYAGLVRNLAVATAAGVPGAIGALSTPTIAIGMGFLFSLGPNWYLRLDGGLDRWAGGLMIKF